MEIVGELDDFSELYNQNISVWDDLFENKIDLCNMQTFYLYCIKIDSMNLFDKYNYKLYTYMEHLLNNNHDYSELDREYMVLPYVMLLRKFELRDTIINKIEHEIGLSVGPIGPMVLNHPKEPILLDINTIQIYQHILLVKNILII